MAIWGLAEDQLQTDAQQGPELGQELTVRARGRARGGHRRLRAGAGGAGAGVPRHPPAGAGAAGAQHLGRRRVRGCPVRRHPRPGAGRRRGHDQAADRGALADRYADDVDAHPVLRRRRAGRRGHRARRRTRPRPRRSRRSSSPSPDTPSRRSEPSIEPRTERGSAARRADLARHPAAGPDDLDRAVGLRGAARRVRRQRRGPVGRAGPSPWRPTTRPAPSRPARPRASPSLIKGSPPTAGTSDHLRTARLPHRRSVLTVRVTSHVVAAVPARVPRRRARRSG